MDDKLPPEELIEILSHGKYPPVSSITFKYKGLFHQSCAPWVAPCFHTDTKTSQYVNMEGIRLSNGKIFAVGRCPLCAKMLWAETTRNF